MGKYITVDILKSMKEKITITKLYINVDEYYEFYKKGGR